MNVNQEHIHHSLSVVLANGLMTLGIGVTWLGIRAFKGAHQAQAGPILAALLVMLLLWLFRFHFDNLSARLGIASIVLATMTLLCARELLIPAEQPLRTGYWLAGGVALLCGAGLTLRAVASLTSLSPTVAISDNPLQSATLLGRYGGEEFILILPGLDTDSARQVAERIRLGLCRQPWQAAATPVPLSVSLGIACSDQQGYLFDILLGAADAALYQAKALGRNRVEVARHPGTDSKDEMALRLLSQFRHNLDV